MLGERKEMAPEELSQRLDIAISGMEFASDRCDIPNLDCQMTCTYLKFIAAAFFTALVSELILWRMKPQWRCGVFCLSSFHLLHMTFILFISFDKDYGKYAVLVLPPAIAATLLGRNLWPGVRQQSMDDAFGQDVDDFMLKVSAIIINLDSVISMAIAMIITISGHTTSGPRTDNSNVNRVQVGATGLFLFFAFFLSLYLIMAAAFRTMVLTIEGKFLHVLFIMFLLVSAFIVASTAFVYFMDKAAAAAAFAEGEVPT